MSRTKKKPYSRAKRISKKCRNHGSCPWCTGNRTFNTRKKLSGKQITDE